MNGAQTHLLSIQAGRRALVNNNGGNNTKAQERFVLGLLQISEMEISSCSDNIP